ncbi:DNA-processing protein DprA [Subtercola boreus]|uniref:DNA protecting protein DprA n=1 Tax=Subtercola boreus TaxID=120213 RepID=A0A3E0WBZ3_9MICO|nr:DNA-processing protein DprA [Subtercola boreus]RFA22031.1 DNA protecting protein DprA [Subtercola boreus]RFA22211.1 DNA protecting protein DprA [Subtercola boreus]RFA28073.1 DNA protecting protein DprA [Subtercola boreus]
MSIFSLDETVVVEAVVSVSPDLAGGGARGDGVAGDERDGPPADDELTVRVAERFARATWSGIAEPGDSLAGLLVRALGAGAALSALVEHRTSTQLSVALAEAGAEGIPVGDLDGALERWRPRLISSSALTTLRLAARCGARLVVPGDPEWPEALGDLGPHEPLALWMRGRPDAAGGLSNSIAVVGARAATGYGEHMAMEIAAGLADRGYGVVSGAAYGVDGMAHRSALASSGQTFAFLAGGVDRFYPSGHDALLSRIAEVGVVLSELPCGSAPTKWRFLQRNRLIAAAARATVVVEAGVRSGSLNTAAHAAALGRPLGAVPGPVTSLSSAGCHRLLREFDATCVTTADEVIEMIGPSVHQRPRLALDPAKPPGEPLLVGARASSAAGGPPRDTHRSAEQVRVLDAVSRRTPRRAVDIARRSGLSVAVTQAALGTLGVDGAVHEREGGWCSGGSG